LVVTNSGAFRCARATKIYATLEYLWRIYDVCKSYG
jgi:hypothetical protein